MTKSRTTLAPLRKVVTVPATPQRAFELFTAEMGAWWPLRTHSVGKDAAAGVAMESRVGGRIVETLADGSTSIWGTLTAWEPPHQVAFTWHPGHEERHATDVEVLFSPAGDQTRVELVHTGWERHPGTEGARREYDTGWDFVLGKYAEGVAG